MGEGQGGLGDGDGKETPLIGVLPVPVGGRGGLLWLAGARFPLPLRRPPPITSPPSQPPSMMVDDSTELVEAYGAFLLPRERFQSKGGRGLTGKPSFPRLPAQGGRHRRERDRQVVSPPSVPPLDLSVLPCCLLSTVRNTQHARATEGRGETQRREVGSRPEQTRRPDGRSGGAAPRSRACPSVPPPPLPLARGRES